MADIVANPADWFNQNFVNPIMTQGVAGYNVVNTIVYGLVFALAVFGVYKLLQKLKINIDKKFLLGIVPFIVMGAVFRVVRDANIYNTWVFVSPIIYAFIFVVALLTLLLAIGVEKLVRKRIEKYGKARLANKARQIKIPRILTFLSDYHKLWAIMGIVLVISGLIMLAPLGVKNWTGVGMVIILASICAAILILIYKYGRSKPDARPGSFAHWIHSLFSKENTGVLGVHLFDASTTFVAVGYFDYYEQHVVSSAAISIIGPVAQFILKITVVLVVLWALDKYLKGKENDNLRNFLKIAIIILGLAPGLRNFTRLALGV